MRKLLFLVCATLLCSKIVYAQEYRDVIYLNNGNIIQGSIISITESEIQTAAINGETYTFRNVEINKIDKGERLSKFPKTEASKYKDYSEYQQGYWIAVDAGLGVALDRFRKKSTTPALPIDFNLTMGYRFNEYIMVGIGGGVRYYALQNNHRVSPDKNDRKYAWAFPLYGQVRGAIISGESRIVVPYWQLSVGHTFNDGFMVQPAIGLRIGSAVRNHFTLALGYTAQRGYLYKSPENYKYGNLHLMQLKFGYQF
jgi:hypothetical protein